MAKRVRISDDDGSSWNTLPGNTGSLANEGNEIDDTIFGQDYKSSLSGLVGWTVSANSFYKGFAGYEAILKTPGTPITAAGEATTQIGATKTYQISTASKQIWDRTVAVVVKDNAVDHTADVVSIDYLFGKVTFAATYSVTGPVTVDVDYIPMAQIARGRGFNLTQTMDPIDESDYETVQANSGHMTFSGGLKTVALEMNGVYAVSNGFRAALIARTEVIVEINPDGDGVATGSLCRGFFRFTQQSQAGAVGALEEETISMVLSVPDDDLLEYPFAWNFASASTLNTAIQIALTGWQDNTVVDVQYLPDGTTGVEGDAFVQDISLAGGLEQMNEFTVNLQGSGALSTV